ncbi:MAG: DUF3298 domain-containing protein [Bacteroidales bacterium]|jgi:hypothetical protein|nr:DUF3298 domain-containing protein [Bacteroidales bacterium]
MRKLFAFASALLVLAACDMVRTETYQDDLIMPLEEGQADSLFFSASVEYIVTGMKVEVRQKINSAIVTQAFDLENSEGSLEEVAIRYRENLIDEYMNENAVLENGIRTWEDRISGNFQPRYKDYRNYQISYYSFRGGAHGIQTLSNIVFDNKTGDVVREQDLFTPGYEEPVAQLLRLAVKTSMEEEDPELMQLVQLELVVPNGNFCVREDGVEWLFQPYEVGPYALGIVSATLSWEELKPFLK